MEGTSRDWESAPAGWRWGDFVLETVSRRLLRHGEEVRVEDRVFDLIVLLLHQREHALDRRQIIEALWGTRPVSDATLRQLVHKARRALDDDGEHQMVIRTLYGRSLQWVAPVEPVTAPPPTDDAGSAAKAWPEVDRRATSAIAPAMEAQPAQDPTRSTTVRPPSRRVLWGSAAGSLLIVLAVSLGVLWWRESVSSRLATASSTAAPAMDTHGAVTLAVLPFLNMDADKDLAYLSDGLTEELINQLGRYPQLRVAARTSSFVFRDKPVDVRAAARKLGVGQLVEGSVQRSGARIRVRVALVSAGSGYELWSDEYDATAGDLLKVEAEIAQAVVDKLLPKLDARTLAELHVHPTVNPAAHDFYLVGLEYLNRRTTPDINRAIAYFQRAIQTDPGYAPAWSGVAIAYALLTDYDSDLPPDTHYADALSAANKAIELDPRLSTTHAVLGKLEQEHWQWASAAHEFQLALQIDPSNATAHQWYGMYLWFTGEPAAGLAQIRIAHDLDPLSPIINTDLGRALLYAGQADAAIQQHREAIALNPRFPLTHVFLAEAYMTQNRFAEALQEMHTTIALAPQPTSANYLAMLGLAQSLAGDTKGTKEQLAIIETRSHQQYVSGVSLALLHEQLGERDKVFADLSRAVADHDHLMLPVIASRGDPWQDDPRFAQLRVKMGLPAH